MVFLRDKNEYKQGHEKFSLIQNEMSQAKWVKVQVRRARRFSSPRTSRFLFAKPLITKQGHKKCLGISIVLTRLKTDF